MVALFTVTRVYVGNRIVIKQNAGKIAPNSHKLNSYFAYFFCHYLFDGDSLFQRVEFNNADTRIFFL